MNIRTCARALVVLLQMIALPIYADFDPTNPPEPNITYKLIVGATPAGSAYTSGSGNFREGERRRVSASPYSNYKLLYWTINGYRYHETSTSFYYTMGDSAVTLIAHYEYNEPTPPPFEPGNPPEPYVKQYVTVDINPAEGGTTSGSGSYTNGEKVTVRANLDTDYEFQSWTINGYPWSATSTTFTYTVADTNAHFVAHVAKKHMITLKTNPRAAGTSTMKMNGTEIGNQLVAKGKNIDFSTIGNEDYVFNHWAINGYKHTTATSFRYTVGDSAAAVVAMYDYIGTGDTTMFNPDNPPEPDLRYDVTIIVIPDNEEKGSTEGGGTYVYGTIDTLYAYPAEGFAFRYWNDGITDNPRIITATQDSLFIAYFGNDTAVWNDTICYGEYLQVGDSILYESGHYEFYTPRPDGLFTWNIVDLTVWHEMSTRLEATICYGDTLEYEGKLYFETNVYIDSLQNEFGCDSIVVVDFTVRPKIEPTYTYDTIQPGETREWNGEIYTSSGYYTKTLTSSNGCDSLDILHLTVNIPIIEIYDTICEGETYYLILYDVMYSMISDTIMQVPSPTYPGELEYVYVYLHKLPAIPETVVDTTICEGEPFYWNGNVYYSSIYDTILLTSQYGCDSLVILNLTMNPSNATPVDFQTICEGDSYCWYVTGECFTKDTIVYYTDECNNSYALDLTVRKSAVSLDDTIYVVEGSNYSWHGNVYTTSGHYTTTLQDEFECEYTANLYLTYVADVAWDSFCEGSVYTWDGHFTNNNTTPLIFSESGTYLDTIVGAYGEEYIYVLYLDKVAKPVLTTCSDTTIQLGDSVLLWATGADYIHWTSDDYLTQTDELSYYAKPKVTTTYTVTGYNLASGKGANVVYNGNFDDGNVGFYTDCKFFTPYTSPGSQGTYTIADNVQGFWKQHVPSVSAYGGTGNMMILDGKTTAHSIVWQQTVHVKPHTYYAFSAQVMSALDSNCEGQYALLQFNVDGEDIGPIFHSPDILYEWTEFYNMLYSGEKTTATLTIYNQNDNPYGNDFAIDEISLIELQTTCQDEKFVTVTVSLPSLVDTIVCSNDIPFEWNGLTVDTAGLYQTYVLSSSGRVDSVATMIVSIKESSDTTLNYTICYGEAYEGIPYFADTTFIYYLNNINGCDSIIYMHLTVLPEDIQIDYDTICEGESYSWNGMHYKESGIHTFSYTNQYGCEAWRYLYLHVIPRVDTTFVYETICYGESIYWNAEYLDSTGQYYSYFMSESTGCDSIAVLDLTVLPKVDTTYQNAYLCYGQYEYELLMDDGVTVRTYKQATIDTITFKNIEGCDSVLIFELIEVPEMVRTFYDTICYGEIYVWEENAGKTYSGTCVVSDTMTSINGCDSILTLYLTELDPIDIVISDTICYGEQYYFNDSTYTESTTVTATFMDVNGCDSVVTLKLHVLPKTPVIIETISACDSISWNGKIYTTTGIYHDTLTTINGCDSVASLNLTIHNTVVSNLYDTACNTYTWHNGVVFTESGTYYDTLSTEYGCDSILVLHLTINHSSSGEKEVFICYGETYTWEGSVYDSPGLYSTVLSNHLGCDSTAYLHLIVLSEMVQNTVEVSVCPSELPYKWYGMELTDAGVYIHRQSFHNNVFCDSVEHVLTLNVLENASSDATVVACDSYIWNGVTYTASGDYIYTTTATNGCDSTATLHLTINNSVSSDEYATICYGDAYFWNNIWCNTTDTYSISMTNSKGCDSIVNLHLTVLPELERIEEWAEVCYGESYTWYGRTYTKSGTYSETYIDENGCEGMAYLYLTVKSKLPTQNEWVEICYGDSYTWNGITYVQSGDYKASYVDDDGCTGEKILHLTVWPKSPAIEEWATITNGDTYSWNGSIYDTEGTYTLSTYDEHGCPQDMILHLDVQTLDFTVNVADHCANDPYIDFDIQSDMIMDKLHFQFGSSSQWRDTVVYTPGQYVSIPNNARAGVYNVVISAYAEGRYLGTKTQEYTLLYPSSVLDQHWDDFIGVLTHNYNGGYDFVSFQWYKNNEPLKDENKSYLSQPLEMGEMYSAMLEDVNGLKLMTCPIIATHQEELYLYPSLAEPKQLIHIRTSLPATIEMYNLTGTQLYKAEYEPGENMLEAPNTSGVYIVKVIYHDDTNKVLTRKITIR